MAIGFSVSTWPAVPQRGFDDVVARLGNCDVEDDLDFVGGQKCIEIVRDVDAGEAGFGHEIFGSCKIWVDHAHDLNATGIRRVIQRLEPATGHAPAANQNHSSGQSSLPSIEC